MTEVYQPIGNELSWAALMIFPLMTIIRASIPWTRKRMPVRKVEWIICGVCVALAFLGLPFEVVFGFLCFAGAIAIFAMKSTKLRWNWPFKIAMSATFIFLGWSFINMGSSDTRLVLQDDRVVYTFFGETKAAPRQDLAISEVIVPREWWQTRSWSSWTTLSHSRLGPFLKGDVWYLGPHGFLRGDDVGRRLAAWAGTKPAIKPWLSDAQTEELMKRIQSADIAPEQQNRSKQTGESRL